MRAMGAKSGILVWAVSALVAAGVLAPTTAGLWHGHAHAPHRAHQAHAHAGHACSHGHDHHHDHAPAPLEGTEDAPADEPAQPEGPCTVCVLLGQPVAEGSAPMAAPARAVCTGVVDEATPGQPGSVRWTAALARGPPRMHG